MSALRTAAAAPFAFAVLALGAPALAQNQVIRCDREGDLACSFNVEDSRFEPVPSVLKLRARISQARLPVGDRRLSQVQVELRRGRHTLCREEISDVQVLSSALALEVGRNMDCDLGRMITQNEGLSLRVCINGRQNCLRPIALGVIPYASKANATNQAQRTRRAEQAGTANFAHLLSADRALSDQRQIATGLLDPSTPIAAPLLYPEPSDFGAYAKGGFLTWRPVKEDAPTLHVSAHDARRDTPAALGELVLASQTTRTPGTLQVASTGTFDGDADLMGRADVETGLTVHGGGVQVSGALSQDGALRVVGRLDVDSGDGILRAQGDSDIDGALLTSQGLLVSAGGVAVVGNSLSDGALSVDGAIEAQSSATLEGAIRLGDAPGDATLEVAHSAVFEGPVFFDRPVVVPDFELPEGFTPTGGIISGDVEVTGHLAPETVSGFSVEHDNCFLQDSSPGGVVCPGNTWEAAFGGGSTLCCEMVLRGRADRVVPEPPERPDLPDVQELWVPYNTCVNFENGTIAQPASLGDDGLFCRGDDDVLLSTTTGVSAVRLFASSVSGLENPYLEALFTTVDDPDCAQVVASERRMVGVRQQVDLVRPFLFRVIRQGEAPRYWAIVPGSAYHDSETQFGAVLRYRDVTSCLEGE